MARTVKLNDLETVLNGFDYPVSREAVVTDCEDVTLALADGEVNLGAIIEQSGTDRYASEDDLSNEVYNLLPRHAVGEPYQSEGEG